MISVSREEDDDHPHAVHSLTQYALHPSPALVLPSSQVSYSPTLPSPHVEEVILLGFHHPRRIVDHVYDAPQATHHVSIKLQGKGEPHSQFHHELVDWKDEGM